ncbi:hypothetical protein MLD38_005131 [Melastoma candidum]|uniref:Uncharacterized protein n=1 Tax=Melastoma candidum TaxID=119954 RepID=A0ACB9SCT6_9MYRT|nr:hypothetical protein MLD38_005131 [Melastoma candidum]
MDSEKPVSDSPGLCFSNKEDDGDGTVLPGFRFHPTDEELIRFYLQRKVEKKPLRIDLIKQVDIYKYDPWNLAKVSAAGDKEWYFFCMRGRKYRNSIRPNRVTGSGFWKATGIDKPIYSSHGCQDCIGLKKSLVYYRGSAGKGTKTDWMMHEFRLPPLSAKNACTSNSSMDDNIAQEAEVWTICRILRRISPNKKYGPTTTMTADSSDTLNNGKDHHSINSSSQTSSYESGCTEQNASALDSINHQPIQIRKPSPFTWPVHERRDSFTDSVTSSFLFQETYMVPAYNYPQASISDANGHGDIFSYSSKWDELRTVVNRAMDHP